MSDTLITVEGVSKKFCKNLKRSLIFGAMDIGSELIGIKRKASLRKDEFWAVQDVSFEVKRGECLGLIGHNGAGKSTLLKMLNGLIAPDKGRITMKGRIGALIELGTGFNPILTGRENVYNNGAVLGFSRQEIDCKFDTIVDFAEVADFIDMPVQNYSSGMKVRLGFAVAAQMEPDVLIIDEVLAVGDIPFMLKCFNKIDSLVPNCAIVFVSHSMPMISRICTHALVLQHGAPVFNMGNVATGIDYYYRNMPLNFLQFIRSDSGVNILNVCINDSKEELPSLQRLDDMNIRVSLSINDVLKSASVSFLINDAEQKPIGMCSSPLPLDEFGELTDEVGPSLSFRFSLKIPCIQLSKGIYSITLILAEKARFKPIARINNILHFQIISDRDIMPAFDLEGVWSKT